MSLRPSRSLLRPSGFTLVEVVVALTLLTLLLIGLVSALRSFGQTSVRLEAQTLANDDMRLVGGLLQRALARSSPRPRMDVVERRGQPWFEGNASAVAWLGHLPARHGAGGLTHLKLERLPSADQSEAGGLLMLRMARFDGDQTAPYWLAEDSRVLLDRVDAITIKYQGLNEAGETVWFEDWQEQTSLPSMVEITLTVADRPWPPIVVQIEQSSAQAAPGRRGLRSSLSWR